MKHELNLAPDRLRRIAGGGRSPAASPSAQSSVDIGTSVPDAAAVKDGLFPEDACKELEASGFKCMGLKPAVSTRCRRRRSRSARPSCPSS